MKLASAFLFLFLPQISALSAGNDADESSSSARAYLRKTRDSSNNGGNSATARGNSKGQLLAKGNFGKIDISSDAAAQQGAKGILESLSKNGFAPPGLSGKEKFDPISSHQGKNSKAKHIKFQQQIHGMDVEGAAIFVHTDGDGEVTGVNGEMMSDFKVPSSPTFGAGVAIKAALDESRVPAAEHGSCNQPKLTVVRGLKDGKAHLAWTCTVRYDVTGADGHPKPFKDQIFAKATGESPGLLQIHPKIYGATPSMNTIDCNEGTNTRKCETVSTSSTKISTGDKAMDMAHNYAIDTFNYYDEHFGRNSIDGNGMTLISRVHYDRNYVNAFWDGSRMTYGDGDGVVSDPLSQDADVVAHELTHGVTERSSNLIYSYESGALNEAMSDIFGALVEQSNGETEENTWLVGEDIWKSGFLRSMCDPAAGGDYDHYPTRYQGSEDGGGVHWNSGIANLAACLMVKGGTHPRGKTSTVVTPLLDIASSDATFDELGRIWYEANTMCLTPSSDFAGARYCTADMHGGNNTARVHEAWDAVGISNDPPPPAPSPIQLTGGTMNSQAADTGNFQQYTMSISEGSTVSCSTSGNNGDADLYVRFNEEAEANPESGANDCGSYSSTSNEACTTGIAPTGTTVAYAGVHAFTGYSGLTVSCTEDDNPSCPSCLGVECCAPQRCVTGGKPSNRGCQ